MNKVELRISGYTFTCRACGEENDILDYAEEVACEYCGAEFETQDPSEIEIV